MFQHLILGLLREQRRGHGYALAKAYERLSGNPGYPANVGRELRRLEKKGLVKREGNPGEDRPIFFEITPKGSELFDNWLVSPRALEEDFSTWLLFMERIPPDLCARLLERREEDLWFMLKRLNRARDDALTLLKRGRGNNHPEAEAAHLRLRIMLVSTELDFIAELRREISSGVKGALRIDENRKP